MKNIKLKYFAVALMMVLQWSCATNETLIDAKNDSDIVSDTQFDVIPGMKYIVDDKEIVDRNLLVTAQKKAWNVHFDFPENKVVISTTEREFSKYVNSNELFKQHLEENTRDAINQQKEESIISNSSKSSSRDSATPTLRVDFSNTAFFNISYRPFSQPATTSNYVHYSFKASSNSDVFNLQHIAYKTTVTATTASTTTKILNVTQGNNFYKVGIRNSQESGSVTKSFYALANYRGPSKAYTVGANSTVIIPYTIVFKSYK